MTPTEQDKELRESVRKIANHFELSVYENQKNGRNSIRAGIKLTDSILGLIAADRKRVALEARIDEINYLDDNFQVNSQDWEREHPGYSTAMIPMEDYIRRRTELKAKQEEAK